MTEPLPLAAEQVDAVAALARVIWQATYPALISQAQIDAMLADRYATPRIRAQLEDPAHAWRVVLANGSPVAFAHAYRDGDRCKLDKLYVHPAWQRRGLGQRLFGDIERWARAQQAHRLWLQVNRGNTGAIRAYTRYGLQIVEARVFDIGGGFVMDDYVMEKPL